MSDFLSAIGLVLVIEGVLYAGFPDAMKRILIESSTMPGSRLRVGGIVAMAVGVAIVWLVRT